MSKTAINTIELTDTLKLSECSDGYWLWDEVAGLNIAIRAKSEREAFVVALSYYQRRTAKLSKDSRQRRQFMEDLYEKLFDEFGDHDAIEFAHNYR